MKQTEECLILKYMIRGFKIIDSHCHIYPDKVAEKASGSISAFYGGEPVRYNGSLGSLLTAGKTAGIDRFIVQSVATTPNHAESINRFIAEKVNESGGKLIGLGTLHPDSKNIAAEIKHIKELGLKGVKLHADIQRIAINDPRCYKIYEILEGGLPVLLHTGDSRYNYSNPDNLIPVLKDFKNLTVVGAHFGGWSVWEEAARKLARFENLYVDTSSTFGFKGIDFTKEILSKHDKDRVLFGSDYPMWDANAEIEAILSLGLSDGQLEKIFSKNCARVYGL